MRRSTRLKLQALQTRLSEAEDKLYGLFTTQEVFIEPQLRPFDQEPGFTWRRTGQAFWYHSGWFPTREEAEEDAVRRLRRVIQPITFITEERKRV